MFSFDQILLSSFSVLMEEKRPFLICEQQRSGLACVSVFIVYLQNG